MSSSTVSTIHQMDKLLGEYYKSLGKQYYDDEQSEEKTGKFQNYCQENGFDDTHLAEEFKHNADECSFVDFDGDPGDDTFSFPLAETTITTEQERQEAVMKILKSIYEHGTLPQNIITSKFSIDLNIPQQNISNIIDKIYKKQLKCCLGGFNELDLLHFFAVGYANDVPFLTWMVDAFSLESAKIYFESNRKHIMTLSEWIQNNAFFAALDSKIAKKLKMAMTAYTTRLMPRLALTVSSPVLVKDDMSQIVDYVVAVPRFIKALLGDERTETLPVSPPFCIDVLFAVHDVTFDKEAMDEKQQNLHPIGDLQQRLKRNQCEFSCHEITKKLHQMQSDSEANDELIPVKIATFSRYFKNCYDAFRTQLIKTKNKDEFNPKTYPNGKRFAIFIDRRKSKEKHEITFFEQLKEYGTIPSDHIAEWFMDSARGCLVPGAEGNENKITSMDAVGGKLLTFSFHVEATDEIKCYVIWNQQTILFKGDNLADILSYLFVDCKDIDIERIQPELSLFNDNMIDKRFNVFCQQINNGYRPYAET